MDADVQTLGPSEQLRVGCVKLRQTGRVLNCAAPDFLVRQLEQEDAVVVFFHEQAEFVVLGLKACVFVGEHYLLHVGVHFLFDQLVLGAGEIFDITRVHPGHKVTYEVGLAVHAEQGQIHFPHAHPCERRAIGEEVVDASGSVLQGVQTLHVNRHAVFLLQLAQERRFGDLGAAVATHLFRQLAAAFVQRRQRLFVQQLDEVEAVVGPNWTGDFTHLRHGKGRVFEVFDHLARPKPRQHAAFVGGRGVLAVLHGEGFERAPAHQKALHFHDATLGVGDLILRRRSRHAHHNVRHLNLSTGFALAGDLQDVIAKPRADDLADLALRRFKCSTFEGVDHLEGREPAQIASVALHRRIFASALASGHFAKVRSVDDAVAKGLDAVPSDQGVCRRGVGPHAHQNVAGAHFHALPLKGFFHQLVQQVAVHHVGTGELVAVAGEFLFERTHGVHAHRLGFEDFELEVHKQLHVGVQRFCCGDAVLVVFAEHVLEIRQGHVLVAHFQDDGFVGHAWGLGGGELR